MKLREKTVILLFLAIIISLVVVFRLFPLYEIVMGQEGYIMLLGNDPYFYLRQVETCIKNFPNLQVFDHATHFPNGVISDNTGLYPWLVAGICRLFYGLDATTYEVSKFMAFIPVVLAAGCGLLVFGIAAKLRTNIAGIVAAFLFTIYPGLFLSRSLIGFPDHHVIEVFLLLSMIFGLTFIDDYLAKGKIKYPILASFPFVAIFTMWSGAPLYLILIPAMLFLLIIYQDGVKIESAGKFGAIYLISAGILYSAISFFNSEWLTTSFPRFTYLIIPAMFGGGIGMYLISIFLKTAQRKVPRQFIIPSIFIILTLSVLILFNYTQVGKAIFFRLTYKATEISENTPRNWADFFNMVALPGLITLIYGVYLFIKSLVGKLSYKYDLSLIFVTIFFVQMWLNTYDMGYVIAPLIALVTGLALYDLCIWSIKKENNITSNLRYVFMSIPYLVFIFCFLKPMIFPSQKFPYQLKAANNQLMLANKEHFKAAEFMRNQLPELPFPTDVIIDKKTFKNADDKGYGIHTIWDLGNIINQRGHRIPTWSRWNNINKDGFIFMEVGEVENIADSLFSESPYLMVDYQTLGRFFPGKYMGIGNLSECQDSVTFNLPQGNALITKIGSCWKNSLVYKLMSTPDSVAFLEPIYTSNVEMITGNFANNNSTRLYSIERALLPSEAENRINENGYVLFNNGIFYNTVKTPAVMIFKYKKEKKDSEHINLIE